MPCGEKVRGFPEALEEDFVLAEEIQGGLRTGANETLRFGRYEDALTAWHRRLEERLAVLP